MNPKDARESAVADVLGALCYALLQTFEAAARGATTAPSIELAEQQTRFAADELQRYQVLRARLAALTPSPELAMGALRAPMDAFYGQTRPEGWLETQVFHFVGDTITTDFAELLSPRLDAGVADDMRRALTGRTEQEAFALEQILEAFKDGDGESKERVARYARTMVGQALNTLRDTLLENDALEVVLGEGGVKDAVLELLGRHRERLERLGLDSVE